MEVSLWVLWAQAGFHLCVYISLHTLVGGQAPDLPRAPRRLQGRESVKQPVQVTVRDMIGKHLHSM